MSSSAAGSLALSKNVGKSSLRIGRGRGELEEYKKEF